MFSEDESFNVKLYQLNLLHIWRQTVCSGLIFHTHEIRGLFS